MAFTALSVLAMGTAHPATLWWDVNTAPGVGGSATWGQTFSTSAAGNTALVTATSADDGIFEGTAGTVTLNAAQSINSLTFNVSGYSITTASTTGRTLTAGSLTLADTVSLTLSSFTNGALTFSGTAITGGTGSSLSVGGSTASATDIVRINVNSGTSIAASAPITINTAGTGLAGFVASVGTGTINANITNNTTTTTMLGATTTLNVAGTVSGTAKVQFSAGSAGTGAGTVNLTGNNDFTGATIVAVGSPNGRVVLNATTGQALGSTSSVTVNSGSLVLGKSNQINDSAPVTLGGGTLNLGGFSEGTAVSGGAGVGALTLTANSTIDFGTGTNSILHFASVGAHTAGTGPDLAITNWNGVPNTGGSGDRLLFTGTITNFTTQYDQTDVSFNGLAGYQAVQFGDFFEVTAVPEPSTWAAGILTLAALGYTQRKRLRKLGSRNADCGTVAG